MIVDDAAALRQLTGMLLAEVPVIAYSSADAAAVRDAFLAAGAVAYVEKPDIAGLQRAVAEIAERT